MTGYQLSPEINQKRATTSSFADDKQGRLTWPSRIPIQRETPLVCAIRDANNLLSRIGKEILRAKSEKRKLDFQIYETRLETYLKTIRIYEAEHQANWLRERYNNLERTAQVLGVI